MQNVIVTGGAGFIGRHLVNELLNKNCKVRIIDNHPSRAVLKRLKLNAQKKGSLLVSVEDIRNIEAVSKMFTRERIDTCIHLAAMVGVQDCILRPQEAIDINVKGTLNMLELCSKHQVQNFIFASSAAVYGNPSKLPLQEAQELQPISPYGASKVAGESLVLSYRSKIKNCVSLRFFNVYGKGQNPHYSGVITNFVERLSMHLPPLIYGDGHQTRDFIFIDDVVRAIILAADSNTIYSSKRPTVPTFNIGTGTSTRISELAQIMIDIYGLKQQVHPLHLNAIDGDIVHSYAKIDRAKKFLKFTATLDLKPGLLMQFSLQKKQKNFNPLHDTP